MRRGKPTRNPAADPLRPEHQQITRAMELVAASKLRRAQERVLASRPYAERLEAMIARPVALRATAEARRIPLLAAARGQNSGVIVITPTAAWPARFNTNIMRRASRFILSEASTPVAASSPIGKKARDFWSARGST